jgi:hypothetical protein
MSTGETMIETPTPTPTTYESCEQCGSAVDNNQRYCVVCGSRRKHVQDPALRYMASASARTRGATASTSRPARRKGSASLGTALVIAVIPVAVALGLVIGHSDNGANAKLLSALRNAHGENVYVQAGGGSESSGSNGGSSSSGKSNKHGKSSKSGNNSGQTLNTTKYGSFNSVASLKAPTQQQQQQGAQVVKRDQSDTNQSYVNQQKGLPNVISVP